MYLKVLLTWGLLLGIIVYEIHSTFLRYNVDKKLWKIVTHSILLLLFGLMNMQLGIFCLEMQFENSLPSTSPISASAKRNGKAAPGQKPAAHAKAQKTVKK